MPTKRERYNTYMNDYMKRRYRQRRELMFQVLGDSCSKCGSIEKLEIDHIYWTDKEFNFAKYWNCSLKKFLEELAKCQVLCKSCHIEKNKVDHWDRRIGDDRAEIHGSLSRNEVEDIRGFIELGLKDKEIASMYGVSRETIKGIRLGYTWN